MRNIAPNLTNFKYKENIIISKEEYHRLKEAYIKLKRLEEIDFDLIKQFKDSLEAVKEGRIRRVSYRIYNSFKATCRVF